MIWSLRQPLVLNGCVIAMIATTHSHTNSNFEGGENESKYANSFPRLHVPFIDSKVDPPNSSFITVHSLLPFPHFEIKTRSRNNPIREDRFLLPNGETWIVNVSEWNSSRANPVSRSTERGFVPILKYKKHFHCSAPKGHHAWIQFGGGHGWVRVAVAGVVP